MGVMTVETGDLFNCGAEALGHGVNVKGAMASGIAVVFKNKFPKMHDEYMRLCDADEFLPGSTWVAQENGLHIFNIASQELPGANASYQFLWSAMIDALSQAEKAEITELAIPQIGCGVGGLDWAEVEPLLQTVVEGFNVHLRVIVLPQNI